MNTTVPGSKTLSTSERRRELKRAIVASTIGSSIEWYDFFLYSTVTGLVFARVFFPNSSPALGLLQAFGVYAVGFVARPVGALIFGHYGDRIGRKSTLIATMMLMGVSSFLVGLVPTYDTIGVWGAVALTILRFLQGVGVGGEWAGSILLSMEWSRSAAHRGLIASLPQLGVPLGLFVVNLVVLGFSQMAGDDFLAWGWRVPFWFSIVLIIIGLYIRLGVSDTPVFKRLVSGARIESKPVFEVIRRHPITIMLCALAKMIEQVPFYIFTAFIFAYGVSTLKASRDLLLAAVLTGSVVELLAIPFFGRVSDVIGRRYMYIIGAVSMAVFGFVYFAMLNSGSPTIIFVAVTLSLVPHSMLYGPQAALITESFPGPVRYSGAALGYQLSSIFAGGPAPLIAVWLSGNFDSGYAISWYILACALVSLVATTLLEDQTSRDIDGQIANVIVPEPSALEG